MGGSVRTAPDASYFTLRRTLRRSVTSARVRVGPMPTTDCRLLSLHAPRPRSRGYPRRRPRRSPVAMCGSASEPPPTRAGRGRRWTVAQPTPVPIMPIPPITPTVPIIPIIPIMTIMLCRQGRSMRHTQRTAQLETDVQSARAAAQQHSGGNAEARYFSIL